MSDVRLPLRLPARLSRSWVAPAASPIPQRFSTNNDNARYRDRGRNDNEIGLGHGALRASISAFRDCERGVVTGQ